MEEEIELKKIEMMKRIAEALEGLNQTIIIKNEAKGYY